MVRRFLLWYEGIGINGFVFVLRFLVMGLSNFKSMFFPSLFLFSKPIFYFKAKKFDC